jgi:AcrR family transcriptional regulator
MDEVAKTAGVSHTLLYHYFPNKRRFYIEILRSVTDRLVAATQPTPSDLEPVDRLYHGLLAHVRFADEYSVGYTAIVSGGNGADEEIIELCEAARWRGLNEILNVLGLDEPSPTVRIALRAWHGFTEGAILEWLKARDLDRDELVAILAGALVSTLQNAGILEAQLAEAQNPHVGG